MDIVYIKTYTKASARDIGCYDYTKMYRLGGETDSAIRWRKITGVTSARGTAEVGR